jgi:hypothetical protein
LHDIAIARQIFQNKVFFSLPGEVFLIKKKKKSFYEKFAGRQQYNQVFKICEIYRENYYPIKCNKIEQRPRDDRLKNKE